MKPVRKIKKSLFIPLLLFLPSACANEKVIEDEELAKAYVDLLVVEDFYANNDSLALKRTLVFKKYEMTEEIYDSAFNNITYDSERWENFFTVANEYLDSLKKDVKKGDLKEVP